MKWLQDRLGLGPADGDAYMKEVPARESKMDIETEWGVKMFEEDTNYMVINRVIYNKQKKLQDITDIAGHTEHRYNDIFKYILRRYERQGPGYKYHMHGVEHWERRAIIPEGGGHSGGVGAK